MANEVLWFKPVCDEVLSKIVFWHETYEKGEVAASRQFLETDGRVTDKSTMYAHKLRFTELQITHLDRILQAIIPKRPCTDTIHKVYEGIKRKKGILIPPNYYQVTLIMYKNEIKEIFDALVKAKTGMASLDDLVNNQEGKSPFEL